MYWSWSWWRSWWPAASRSLTSGASCVLAAAVMLSPQIGAVIALASETVEASSLSKPADSVSPSTRSEDSAIGSSRGLRSEGSVSVRWVECIHSKQGRGQANVRLRVMSETDAMDVWVRMDDLVEAWAQQRLAPKEAP